MHTTWLSVYLTSSVISCQLDNQRPLITMHIARHVVRKLTVSLNFKLILHLAMYDFRSVKTYFKERLNIVQKYIDVGVYSLLTFMRLLY